jgi:hypothetical protein
MENVRPPLRILVCGGRDFTDVELLYRTLDEIAIIHGIARVVTGLAAGTDLAADGWAEWRKISRGGYKIRRPHEDGYQRNQRMLDSEPIDLVVAFPGGNGTADMVRRAQRAGIPVKEVKA